MSDCVFCKIIKGQVPTQLIYQADDFIAVKDITPKAPVHLLIIPMKHIASLNEAKAAEAELLGRMLFQAKVLAREMGIDQSGYKVVVNTGRDAGQLVQHLHIHLLGGQRLDGFV